MLKNKIIFILFCCSFIISSCWENNESFTTVPCFIVGVSDNMPKQDPEYINNYNVYPRLITFWANIVNNTTQSISIPFKSPNDTLCHSHFVININNIPDDMVGELSPKGNKYSIPSGDTLVLTIDIQSKKLQQYNLDKIDLDSIINTTNIIYKQYSEDHTFSNNCMMNLSIETNNPLIVHRPLKGDRIGLCTPGIPLDCEKNI